MDSLKRIALVRLDALGDTLLTTPAVQVLREQLPEAEILALTHPAGTPVLSWLCDVEEVSPGDSWSQLAQRLRRFRPDAVLCCSEKRRAALACAGTRAPRRLGFQPGWQQPLKRIGALFTFSERVDGTGCHEVERHVRLVEQLLEQRSLPVPPLSLAIPSRYYAHGSWSEVRDCVGVQLTAKWGLAALRSCLAALPLTPVGLVTPAELAWARRHFPELRLYSTSDFYEYASWIDALAMIITVDTGAAHVAAARQTPVVDVFLKQATVPRWRPWKCPHVALVHGPELAQQVQAAVRQLLQPVAVQDLESCG